MDSYYSLLYEYEDDRIHDFSAKNYFVEDLITIIDYQKWPFEKRIEEAISFLNENKGFGDADQETTFFIEFFKVFFKTQSAINKVQWQQYQDFNDADYDYNLSNLRFNEIEDWNKVDLPFFFSSSLRRFVATLGYEHYPVFSKGFELIKTDIHPADVNIIETFKRYAAWIYIFLSALKKVYGEYYFIYLFGRRANVTVTTKGIVIDNENIIYEDERGDRPFYRGFHGLSRENPGN